MNLNQFAIETFPDWIGFLLVVGVALWGAWQMLIHYLDNAPFMYEEPPRYPVNPSNGANLLHGLCYPPRTPEEEVQFRSHLQNPGTSIENLLLGVPSLRTPLPQHRNQTPPADDWEELLALHGVCAEDRADIIRGSKLP